MLTTQDKYIVAEARKLIRSKPETIEMLFQGHGKDTIVTALKSALNELRMLQSSYEALTALAATFTKSMQNDLGPKIEQEQNPKETT